MPDVIAGRRGGSADGIAAGAHNRDAEIASKPSSTRELADVVPLNAIPRRAGILNGHPGDRVADDDIAFARPGAADSVVVRTAANDDAVHITQVKNANGIRADGVTDDNVVVDVGAGDLDSIAQVASNEIPDPGAADHVV